jgi:hypothetical protein
MGAMMMSYPVKNERLLDIGARDSSTTCTVRVNELLDTEWLRESRSSGRGGGQSYGLERQVEPLVMASEISGLDALHG